MCPYRSTIIVNQVHLCSASSHHELTTTTVFISRRYHGHRQPQPNFIIPNSRQLKLLNTLLYHRRSILFPLIPSTENQTRECRGTLGEHHLIRFDEGPFVCVRRQPNFHSLKLFRHNALRALLKHPCALMALAYFCDLLLRLGPSIGLLVLRLHQLKKAYIYPYLRGHLSAFLGFSERTAVCSNSVLDAELFYLVLVNGAI